MSRYWDTQRVQPKKDLDTNSGDHQVINPLQLAARYRVLMRISKTVRPEVVELNINYLAKLKLEESKERTDLQSQRDLPNMAYCYIL